MPFTEPGRRARDSQTICAIGNKFLAEAAALPLQIVVN
jgi:hypothetical protein